MIYVCATGAKGITRSRSRLLPPWLPLCRDNGRIITVTGAESNCNCFEAGCNYYDEERHLANYRLRAVTSSLTAEPGTPSILRHLPPETQELYVFDRFGQHVATT